MIDRAGRGDEDARHKLLERYRDYLRRMVAVRLDRRVAARVDASDVVQETLVEAARRLDDYLRDRPLPAEKFAHPGVGGDVEMVV